MWDALAYTKHYLLLSSPLYWPSENFGLLLLCAASLNCNFLLPSYELSCCSNSVSVMGFMPPF